jgi:hypothetical protein
MAGTSGKMASAEKVLDLRQISGDTFTIVVVGGYYETGDGGGGEFHWTSDTTAADDGGMVIVPSALSRTGCWKRLVGDFVDVKWFGAKGDDVQNDAPFIQAAINAVLRIGTGTHSDGRGKTVVFPPGNYQIKPTPQSTAAVEITNAVRLVGTGSPPYASSVLVLRGDGDGIRIEGDFGRGTLIQNLQIWSPNRSSRDAIIVHSNGVILDNCHIDNFSRYGVLIESGNTGLSGGLVGSTGFVSPTSFNVNSWRLTNLFISRCGDPGTAGAIEGGAGVYVHGSDSNNGVAVGCFGQANNVSFCDGSLGGTTFVGCSSEASAAGFLCIGASPSVLVSCGSEDTALMPVANGGINSLVVGGGILGEDQPVQRVGGLRSRLYFSDRNDADTYGAEIPSAYRKAAIRFWRNSAKWSLAYEPTAAFYHYQEKSWQWVRDAEADVSFDPYGTPFGWTDAGNSRGVALPFISNPLLNTVRRWTWKQIVNLKPGGNIIYLSGGLTQGADDLFAQSAATIYPNADTRISVEVQLATHADMLNSDIRVGAHAILSQTASGGNAAVKIYNDGATAVPATIVWHFETFVTNGYSVG